MVSSKTLATYRTRSADFTVAVDLRDVWIGFYWDTDQHRKFALFFCPLPFLVFSVIVW